MYGQYKSCSIYNDYLNSMTYEFIKMVNQRQNKSGGNFETDTETTCTRPTVSRNNWSVKKKL
jgi:hypothetical protein